jgi:hypothetical protein
VKRNPHISLSGAALLLLVALVAPLSATPIKPKLQEVLKATEKPPIKLPAARAGWDSGTKPVNFNLAWEQYGPEGSARQMRASLLDALTPNPLLLAAIFGCIFLLRAQSVRRERVVGQPAPAMRLPERELEAA